MINIEKHIDELRARGFTVLRNLVSEADLANLNEQLDFWFDKTPKCQGDFYGWNTTRFGSLLHKAPKTQELVLNKQVISVVEKILKPNCDWFQLNLSQAVRIHPGSGAQPQHRDEEMWNCNKDCEYLINVMWTIDDFTKENGATRFWPRSQFENLDRLLEDDFCEIAEAPKGSAILFLGSVTHGAGANNSSKHRTGIIFSYCLGWLKQYENQFLAYPKEIACNFPKEIQDLIGYRIHKPNLGGYENYCPSILLQEEVPETLPAVDCLPPEILEQLKQLKAENLI